MYGYIEHHKGINDQSHCGKGNALHGFLSVIFIHNIGHHKLQGPEQHPAGKRIAQMRFAKQSKV
ncbi:hypothetical protein D3C80_1867300 [compost metagenome]